MGTKIYIFLPFFLAKKHDTVRCHFSSSYVDQMWISLNPWICYNIREHYTCLVRGDVNPNQLTESSAKAVGYRANNGPTGRDILISHTVRQLVSGRATTTSANVSDVMSRK